MSDTPRTDVLVQAHYDSGLDMRAQLVETTAFARELERELSFEKAARRDEESWWKETRDYKNRAEKAETDNARLREALKKYASGNYNDFGVEARAALGQTEDKQ